MEPREQRGFVIAATARGIKRKSDHLWTVPSTQGAGHPCYHVNPEKKTCTCLDHQEAGHFCKHLYAVKFVIQREFQFDEETGTTTEIETMVMQTVKKTTYPQNWQAYNAAQTTEKSHFQLLLNDLCKQIPDQPHTGPGRPRLPLGDAIFAACFKVYSTVSGRRFMSDLADAQVKGYIGRVPHFNAVFKVLESEATTPVLQALIAATASPLRALESNFAVDSSGFSSSRFDRWYDHKFGDIKIQRAWVKAHIMCGVKTNVITAVEIHDKDAGDSPQLPPLLNSTTQRFNVAEVSADMGYSAESNLQAILDVGASPYIPFKRNASGKTRGGLWAKMFHYFNYNRDEFMARYHQRSNIESTFSMVKAKFGDCVRSKTDTAMKNEVLAKFVCHNLCCVVQSMYEFNVDPNFSAGSLSAPPKLSLN